MLMKNFDLDTALSEALSRACEEVDRIINDKRNRERSDNYFYSNGGAAYFDKLIMAKSREIGDLEACRG